MWNVINENSEKLRIVAGNYTMLLCLMMDEPGGDVNQMRLIGQATPSVDSDIDYNPVEDLITPKDSGTEHEALLQHSPDRSQPQQMSSR